MSPMSSNPETAEVDFHLYKLKQRHFDACCRRDWHLKAANAASAEVEQIVREMNGEAKTKPIVITRFLDGSCSPVPCQEQTP